MVASQEISFAIDDDDSHGDRLSMLDTSGCLKAPATNRNAGNKGSD